MNLTIYYICYHRLRIFILIFLCSHVPFNLLFVKTNEILRKYCNLFIFLDESKVNAVVKYVINLSQLSCVYYFPYRFKLCQNAASGDKGLTELHQGSLLCSNTICLLLSLCCTHFFLLFVVARCCCLLLFPLKYPSMTDRCLQSHAFTQFISAQVNMAE